MNLYIPPADPLGLPTPPIVFLVLLWLTFVLHLIFMNFVLGGTFILTIQEWLYGRDARIAKANSLMMKVMPVALSLAITMGVAPLLFVQLLYGQFFYTANIMMGWWWMAIIALVTIAFYLIYVMIARRSSLGSATTLSRMIVLINTALFFATAFLFTNNAVLTENPQLWAAIHAGESGVIAGDISLWPRYLHNVIGAIAIAGMWCAGIAWYQNRYHPVNKETADWMYRSGLLWAKSATFINILVGFVYLFTIGMDRLKGFMGGGVMLWGWGLSVLLSFLALALLVMAFMKPDQPKFFWGACGALFFTLFGMAMGRDLLRQVSLQLTADFSVSELMVRPHITSFVMFLVTFAIGLATLAIMLRIVWMIPASKLDEASGGDEA